LKLHSNSLSNIVEVIKLCNLADSRFNYSDEQLNYWAAELQNDFPNSSMEGLTTIIRKGIKGGYEVKSNHITLSVIYSWINQYKKPQPELPKNWWNLDLTPEQWKLVPKEKVSEKENQDIRRKMGL
jgi:hypothetical protein